jgi:hypothetical protein
VVHGACGASTGGVDIDIFVKMTTWQMTTWQMMIGKMEVGSLSWF